MFVAVRVVTRHQSDVMLGVCSCPGDLFGEIAGAYFEN